MILNKIGVRACNWKENEEFLYLYNSMVVAQLYQTHLMFRSQEQMGHQGIDKSFSRVLNQFECYGIVDN